MQLSQILETAQLFKDYYHTDDPLAYANALGIDVIFTSQFRKDFKAQIIKFGQRTVIFINEKFDQLSRKLLCSHEIAHYLFHSTEQTNYYNNITDVKQARLEHEANLFALAIAMPDLGKSISLENLSGYILHEIMEENLSACE